MTYSAEYNRTDDRAVSLVIFGLNEMKNERRTMVTTFLFTVLSVRKKHCMNPVAD